MQSSPLIAIILTAASIGLSLPARADQAATNENVQTVVITGSNNNVNQQNHTYIRGGARGSNTGTSVRNRQTADVEGNNNNVNQSNQTQVDNRHQPRSR